MNDLKVVYSKWYTFDNKQYPFPNGLSDEIINRIQTSELIPIGEYDRISALEDQFFFNNPGSNYYFRNSNFYFHCNNGLKRGKFVDHKSSFLSIHRWLIRSYPAGSNSCRLLTRFHTATIDPAARAT